MKKFLSIAFILLLLTEMSFAVSDTTKQDKGTVKYEKIYVVKTPENPYKKTPQINISTADVLPKIKADHPRMFFTRGRMEQLKKQYASDKLLQKYVQQVLQQSDKICSSSEKKDEKKFLDDMLALGFAYHWTGNAKYAQKATDFLKESCKSGDWDWFHFLSTGDAALTVGIGYDVFYNYFDKSTREDLRYGIIKNGLNSGVAAYSGAPFGWFKDVRHNWNLVCNAGMIISSLAVADDEYYSFFAGKIVPDAVKSMTLAMNEYAVDGAFPEGPGYWHYATTKAVLGIEALQQGLGTDFGLSAFEGFNNTYYYKYYLSAPNGVEPAYADCKSGSKTKPDGFLLWMGGKFGDKRLINYEHDLIVETKRGASVYDVLFYEPYASVNLPALPTDKYFKGPVEIASLRTAWKDVNAVFADIKAGYNQVNHGHLDLGAFEYTALGETWFFDLGAEDYSLPDYFDMNGGRWKYFRTSSLSHNVPLINQQNQNIYATSRFTEVNLNKAVSSVKIDLSEAYSDYSQSMFRTMALDKPAKKLIITDQYNSLKNALVSWQALTDAKISINGKKAILEKNGKKIQVSIVSPANAEFKVTSAEQKAPLKENTGITILKVEAKQQGNTSVQVEIVPVK